MNTIKIIELFGGIGACTQAMKRLGIDFEVVDYVEIDKYAVKSYNAINSTKYEPQDITQWDKDIKADFIMHGSPCQDFSVAGLGKGASEDGGTRSSLMYETIRIVDKVRPKYVLWENVKNVLSKKHRHNFDNYLSKMEELGYHNYYQVLNAKDYGVPQNRERIFVLSCLEDIDYKFPQKQELAIRLKDILEDEVDEKYYISSDKVEKLVKQIVEKQGDKGLGALISQATSTGSIYCKNGGVLNMAYPESDTRRGRVISDGNVCGTIECADHIGRLEIEKVLVDDTNSEQFGNCRLYKDNAPSLRSQRQGQKVVEIEQVRIGGCFDDDKPHQAGSVWDKEGLSPTLDTMQGGWRQPCIVEIQQVGNIVSTGNFENPQRGRIYSSDGCSPALNCMRGGGLEPKIIEVQQLGNINPSGHGQNGSVVSDQGLARTVTVEKGEGQKICQVLPILTPDRLEKRQNGRRCKEDGEPMFTLTGQDRHGVVFCGGISTTTSGHANDQYPLPNVCRTLRAGKFDNGVMLILSENDYFLVSICKLTPKECWRLMGFSDKCFEKAAEVNSNSQLYKQAGNSIVVDVLENIFINLFVENKMETYIPLGQDGVDGQLSIFDL